MTRIGFVKEGINELIMMQHGPFRKWLRTESPYMKDKRGSNVKRLNGMTGLGLRDRTTGQGSMKRPAVGRKLEYTVERLRIGGCWNVLNKFLYASQAI